MGVDDKYTTALLHFDGEFKDESGKIWTPYGNLLECGSKALVTTGGQGLSCASDDFCFGTNDFTIDFWYKQTSWSYNYNSFAVMVLLNIVAQSPAPKLAIGLSDGGVSKSSTLRIWSGSFDKTGTTIVSDGINHHIAVVRSGSSILCFIDGILNLTIPFSGSIGLSPALLSIGACGTYNWGLAGSEIDEFRVSNIARWTSNFAPPTVPYSGVSVNLIATAGDSQVTLSWTAVSEAVSYEVKRFTTTGGPYITIATNVISTNYTDNAVTNGITYYYVVTAVYSNGIKGSNSLEVSATPNNSTSTPDKLELLRVTMNDSSVREYQLSTAEIDGFINWYTRTVGTGTTCYMLNKKVGSQISKEYLTFEKIISFELIPLKD